MTSNHCNHPSSASDSSHVDINTLSGLTSPSAIIAQAPASARPSPPATLCGHIYNSQAGSHPLTTTAGHLGQRVGDVANNAIPPRNTNEHHDTNIPNQDIRLGHLKLVVETTIVCVAAYYGFGRHRPSIEATLLKASVCFYVYQVFDPADHFWSSKRQQRRIRSRRTVGVDSNSADISAWGGGEGRWRFITIFELIASAKMTAANDAVTLLVSLPGLGA
ncbi:hypothetical protein EJ03DRAFT_354553 [Teratosphaeria nubilosa]|uniref:Uncharacterized protein n=1 Tax=Teratosphaeria nubilosa TaxID=161662 RepID=A0A6G1KYU1_9PEZI|nr:hypothetical protein EJ03DRAFT_354553 [Teratosphaeria nubilosa]